MSGAPASQCVPALSKRRHSIAHTTSPINPASRMSLDMSSVLGTVRVRPCVFECLCGCWHTGVREWVRDSRCSREHARLRVRIFA